MKLSWHYVLNKIYNESTLMEITLVVIQIVTRLIIHFEKYSVTNSKEQCFTTFLAFKIMLCESFNTVMRFST